MSYVFVISATMEVVRINALSVVIDCTPVDNKSVHTIEVNNDTCSNKLGSGD